MIKNPESQPSPDNAEQPAVNFFELPEEEKRKRYNEMRQQMKEEEALKPSKPEALKPPEPEKSKTEEEIFEARSGAISIFLEGFKNSRIEDLQKEKEKLDGLTKNDPEKKSKRTKSKETRVKLLNETISDINSALISLEQKDVKPGTGIIVEMINQQVEKFKMPKAEISPINTKIFTYIKKTIEGVGNKIENEELLLFENYLKVSKEKAADDKKGKIEELQAKLEELKNKTAALKTQQIPPEKNPTGDPIPIVNIKPPPPPPDQEPQPTQEAPETVAIVSAAELTQEIKIEAESEIKEKPKIGPKKNEASNDLQKKVQNFLNEKLSNVEAKLGDWKNIAPEEQEALVKESEKIKDLLKKFKTKKVSNENQRLVLGFLLERENHEPKLEDMEELAKDISGRNVLEEAEKITDRSFESFENFKERKRSNFIIEKTDANSKALTESSEREALNKCDKKIQEELLKTGRIKTGGIARLFGCGIDVKKEELIVLLQSGHNIEDIKKIRFKFLGTELVFDKKAYQEESFDTLIKDYKEKIEEKRSEKSADELNAQFEKEWGKTGQAEWENRKKEFLNYSKLELIKGIAYPLDGGNKTEEIINEEWDPSVLEFSKEGYGISEESKKLIEKLNGKIETEEQRREALGKLQNEENRYRKLAEKIDTGRRTASKLKAFKKLEAGRENHKMLAKAMFELASMISGRDDIYAEAKKKVETKFPRIKEDKEKNRLIGNAIYKIIEEIAEPFRKLTKAEKRN